MSQRRKTTIKNLRKEEQPRPAMKNRYKVLQEGTKENEETIMQEVPNGQNKSTE